MKLFKVLFLLNYFYIVKPISEQDIQPEINDQFETTTINDKTVAEEPTDEDNKTAIAINDIPTETIDVNNTEVTKTERSVINNMFKVITDPVYQFLSIPKVNNVLRNIGTCAVNGVMEIISFYFPAPLIPLIASAAGMVIPFEPIVTLRRRMPVNSYRRALKTAVNGFMNTFDAYKFDLDDDPYMTRRFNRRFMNDIPNEDKGKEDTKND